MKSRIAGLLIVVGLAVGQETVSGCRSCYITYQQPAAPVTQRSVPARGVFSGAAQAGLRAPVQPMPVGRAAVPVQPVQSPQHGTWTQARRAPSVYASARPVRQSYPTSSFSMYAGAKAAVPVRQDQAATLEKEGQIEQQQDNAQETRKDSDKAKAGDSTDTIDAMVDAIVASGREEEKVDEIKGEKKEQAVLA